MIVKLDRLGGNLEGFSIHFLCNCCRITQKTLELILRQAQDRLRGSRRSWNTNRQTEWFSENALAFLKIVSRAVWCRGRVLDTFSGQLLSHCTENTRTDAWGLKTFLEYESSDRVIFEKCGSFFWKLYRGRLGSRYEIKSCRILFLLELTLKPFQSSKLWKGCLWNKLKFLIKK